LLLGLALQGRHFLGSGICTFDTGRIVLLWSVLTLFSRIAGLFLPLPGFVYQHARRPTNAVVAVCVPSTDETRLHRLERLCFLHATQFSFVRGAEECSVCRFGWVI
jgi:hypothetical protein